jgi:hypothetical protein
MALLANLPIPSVLNRCTQPRSVWRSIPHDAAASASMHRRTHAQSRGCDMRQHQPRFWLGCAVPQMNNLAGFPIATPTTRSSTRSRTQRQVRAKRELPIKQESELLAVGINRSASHVVRQADKGRPHRGRVRPATARPSGRLSECRSRRVDAEIVSYASGSLREALRPVMGQRILSQQ